MKSFGIAALAGTFAVALGGVVAALAAEWYHMSSQNGAAAVFVVLVALGSGVAGSILGLVIARHASRLPGVTPLATAGLACLAVTAIAGGVGGTARLLADIAPTIDGDTLFLVVDIRYPPGMRPPQAPPGGVAALRLGAASRRTVRREVLGALFVEDARQEGGQWVVPGAVEIFTERGTRLLMIEQTPQHVLGFEVPLPRRPGTAHFAWSDWLPHADTDQRPAHERVTYRFRVAKMTAPVRTQTVGPFAVATTVTGFSRTDAAAGVSAWSTHTITRDGRPVAGLREVTAVAVVRTSPMTLLARADAACWLVQDDGRSTGVRELADCSRHAAVWRVADAAADPGGRTDATALEGWVDRQAFAAPGLFTVGSLLLDTRTLDVRRITWPEAPSRDSASGPLALSPDGASVAWFSETGLDEAPQMVVTRIDTGASTLLPVDRTRMRFRTAQVDVDRRWLEHHFAWTAGADGHATLQPREAFTPLPFRGAVSTGPTGQYQSYQLAPGGLRLQQALRELLVTRLGARALPDEYGTPQFELAGTRYALHYVEGNATVTLMTYKGEPATMARLAEAIDRELATGRFDALFVPDPPATAVTP